MDKDERSWRKASYSNGSGDCVEVGQRAATVVIRDTKNRNGGTLSIPADAWRAFADEIKVLLGAHHLPGASLTIPA